MRRPISRGQTVWVSLFIFVIFFWVSFAFQDVLALRYVAVAVGALFLLILSFTLVDYILNFEPGVADSNRRHSVLIKFLDAAGERVEVSIIRSFKTKRKGKCTHEWSFQLSNGIEALEVDPGRIAENELHIAERRILQDFGFPMKRFKLYSIGLKGVFGKCFMNPMGEFWETSIQNPTKLIEISVRFHPDRPPASETIVAHEVPDAFTKLTVPGSAVLVERSLSGEITATWRHKRPRYLSTYRLSWEWLALAAGPLGSDPHSKANLGTP